MGNKSEVTTESLELERLLFCIARGDKDAFAELYRRTRGAVYATALSVLANAHNAEEITHDVFLRIWDNAGRYRAKGSPMAWIMTVTRNLALMFMRKAGRGTELSEEEWNAIPAASPRVTAEDREILQDALGALEPQERQIVLMHAVSGLKHREIAEILNIPLGTVLSKYNRAVRRLRDIMEGGEAL